MEISVPITNRGDNILVEAIALTDVVGVGQQVMEGDDSNHTLPDSEANTGAPNIEIEDTDPNPAVAVAPTPTLPERPARAPKRPNAASKATAYVAAADHTKGYWDEKLKMEQELYNAQIGLLAGQMELNAMQIESCKMQIENQKMSNELLLLQLHKARQELDH